MQYLQEVEIVEKMETLTASQDVRVPINGSINQSTNQSTQCQSTSVNPSFSISFYQF